MAGYSDLSEMQLDVLREIGNIGSGNACTALASLLGIMVDMSVPSIRFLDYDSAADYLGGKDAEVLGIQIGVKADLTGMMFHIVDKRFAQRIISTFYEKQLDTIQDLNEMDLSVLSEMGNITSGAYANSLATLTQMVVDISAPVYHQLSVPELLKIPIEEYAKVGNQILVIDEEFIIEQESLKSHMILVLEEESLLKLFEKLGVTV